MYACDNCGCPVAVRTLPYTFCDVCEKRTAELEQDLRDNVPESFGPDEDFIWGESEGLLSMDDQCLGSYYDDEISANEYWEQY